MKLQSLRLSLGDFLDEEVEVVGARKGALEYSQSFSPRKRQGVMGQFLHG